MAFINHRGKSITSYGPTYSSVESSLLQFYTWLRVNLTSTYALGTSPYTLTSYPNADKLVRSLLLLPSSLLSSTSTLYAAEPGGSSIITDSRAPGTVQYYTTVDLGSYKFVRGARAVCGVGTEAGGCLVHGGVNEFVDSRVSSFAFLLHPEEYTVSWLDSSVRHPVTG